MKFTPEMRIKISNEAKDKVIKSLQWDEEDEYWVMTFTDDSEISFRLMAELA